MSSLRTPRKRPGGEAPSPVPPKKTRSAAAAATTARAVKRADEGSQATGKAGRSRAGAPTTPEKPAPSPDGLATAAVPRKPTLFDDLDAVGSSPLPTENGSSDLQYLQSLDRSDGDSDDSDSADSSSSLSSLADVDFEDVPLAHEATKEGKLRTDDGDGDDGDDDDDEDEDQDVEFEDVKAPEPAPFSFLSMALDDQDPAADGRAGGNLELTLIKDTRVPLTALKKGPTKIERLVRSTTHCVHVQCLLWHNAVRNAWLCDPEVQGLLLSRIPPRLWDEVDRWRRNSGLPAAGDGGTARSANGKETEKDKANGRAKGRDRAKGGGKGKGVAQAAAPARTNGDWSAAKRLEEGAVDMSRGDPLFRLLRALSAWWRQKFRVTAPGLRKTGYLTLERLDRLTKAAKDTAGRDPARFGERIRNRAAFRECAARLQGSRDVGAQLFTALLRALGLETRLVASLQPLGFGWTKLEDADPEAEGDGHESKKDDAGESAADGSGTNGSPSGGRGKKTPTSKPTTPKPTQKAKQAKQAKQANAGAVVGRRKGAAPVVVISDDDNDDDTASTMELAEVNSDNDAVVVLPEDERGKARAGRPSAAGSPYDKDLAFPIYWSEVLSPVTQTYVPVEAMVKHIVATNRELVEALEPRGAKADQARQVMAYVVGYAADGTAKDVTVRYLRRQLLPGRTKGVRFPVEKVPVYNRHGKVRRYDLVDWFPQAALRGYVRGQSARHPLTEADEAEDSTDLRPAAPPEKKPVKEGDETLQYYKQSSEFVLERHLKREEALVAGAVPVRVFRHAKGARAKKKEGDDGDGPGPAENVYLRKDVAQVKSAETWHKQGRAPRAGERPLKLVPYRAATLNRRREIAEVEAASGEKALQGLYSFEQTAWIIPAPIRDGVIPKNAYGNIDLFAQHMLPQGAVHVPYRGAMRVCKTLGVDFAEAVVDFEFGHRMAVPVIQGVVVAEEHHDRVMAQLAKDEAERTRKADEKRRAAALGMWRKLLMGLRIVERIRQDYGDVADDERAFGHEGRHAVDAEVGEGGGGGSGGGFLPEGFEYEDEADGRQGHVTSSFFPGQDEDEDGAGDVGGGFVVE